MPSLRHSFGASAAPAEVFALLADPARVVGCLPGAELDDAVPAGGLREGQEFGGRIAVRLGPVSTRFRGVVRVLELDSERRSSVLGLRADDENGNGSASATMTLSVAAENGGSRVDLGADVDIRGRVATFGAGAVERVSARLLDQFAANLADRVAGGEAVAPTGPGDRAQGAPSARLAVGIGELVPSGAWPLLATCCAFLLGVLVGRGSGFRRRSVPPA